MTAMINHTRTHKLCYSTLLGVTQAVYASPLY